MTPLPIADTRPNLFDSVGAPDGTDMLDMFGAGLIIANDCDAEAIGRMADVVDEATIFLAIVSRPKSNQLLLIVAERHDLPQFMGEVAGRSILVCAASRIWFEDSNANAVAAGYQATGSFYLDTDAARLAISTLRCPMKGRVGALYRATKCRELVCSAMHQYVSGDLVPVASEAMSVEDARRIMEAQSIIATRFAEKLTLGSIARACGLNRTKLARGFRELFNCSIAEALSECRLRWASGELASGRMSISQIAYSAGYLSHASFSRAFAKHFGVPPKQWRHIENSAGSPRSLC